MIADTNIVIYATNPAFPTIRAFVVANQPAVSAITYVEALGFHRLSEQEKNDLEDFFADITLLPINQAVINRAVELRQQRNMSLGDALIAATALVHDLTLVTRNVDDFDWIDDLRLLNPFVEEAE